MLELLGDGLDAMRAEAGTAFDGTADDAYAGRSVDSYRLAEDHGATAVHDDDGVFLGWDVIA